MGVVRIERVYGMQSPQRGYLVLVDRLWPRGIKKAELAMDEWARDVAPSNELRKWYGHDPRRFDEFAERYRAELGGGQAAGALARLADRAGTGDVTLLTATKDVDRSAAVVLAELLRRGAQGGSSR